MSAETDEALTRVTFKMHPQLNENESIKQGRPIYDDIELCEISFPGNKYTIGGFPAHSDAGWADDPLTGIKTKITYAQKYNAQYLAFKNNTAQALGGTPIDALPFLTPGKKLELKACNVHTAEALAALDGNALKTIGMGGRELKNLAVAYLDEAKKNADAGHLKAELEARDAELAKLRREMDAMKSGAPVPPPKPTTDSPFKDFEDEDIGNWIKDAKPEAVVEGLTRDALIAMADGILDEQGKAKQTKKAA